MALQWYFDYPRFLLDLLSGRRVRAELQSAKQREIDLAGHLTADKPLRILDLANGQLRPQYYILKMNGHDVHGIDLVNKPSRSFSAYAYKLARLLYCIGLITQNWRGFAGIWRLLCQHQLAYGDVSALPYPENHFDLIISTAAFEHFLDVPAVVKDMARVLRSGGHCWISIHPFTALSGGHNISCRLGPIRSLPSEVHPWDHLLDRKIPFTVPLNEWRISQYRQEFEKYFHLIKDECRGVEGEELLTPSIERMLDRYSREELLCAMRCLVCTKP